MNSSNVFVISIKRLSHRIEIFKKNNPTISFEVIYGCDKEDLRNKSIIDSHAQISKLNRSEISVFISHRIAWKYMIDHHIEKAFFFEDDVILSRNAKILLKAVNFPDKFQFVRLETFNCDVLYSAHHEHEFNDIRLHKSLSGLGYGSAGYLLSISMARFLLNATEKFYAPIDHVLFGVFSFPMRQSMVCQCVPAICVQEDQLAIRQNRQSNIQSDVSNRSLNYPGYLIFFYRLLCRLRLIFMYRSSKTILYFLLAVLRNKSLFIKKIRIPFAE